MSQETFWALERDGRYVMLHDAPEGTRGFVRRSGWTDDLKEARHDLVMLRAQDDIGCVPPPTKEQWAKAWRAAEELFEP